jgi:hypothetical protein
VILFKISFLRKKMAKVQRHLFIHFNTRFFKGITHEEILSEVEKKVELDNVGSVQFTETDCIISVKDLNTKEKLISGGITGQLTF